MSKINFNSKTRFTNTVEDYAKYRPHYPELIINLLRNECGLQSSAVIADVGSGTGIFAELLLRNEFQVFAVEPNNAMRLKAEHDLAKFSNFKSVNATAENTTLNDASVDCVTAATAFHWFDREKTKHEFLRILKAGGYCLLIWNLRQKEASKLMSGYEDILNQYGVDYKEVISEDVNDDVVSQFFAPMSVKIVSFSHQQEFNLDAFIGRLLSASYTPKYGHPKYEGMIAAAKELFEKEQKKGLVKFCYSAKCYYGQFKS